ncbi:MAG: hypothetical protein M1837_000536 [Sclerophora amabilis]|nr:MAG: hypothetical protein M1837_000536 [Sclerophora amabilis]
MDFQFWMLPEDQMHMDQADEDGRHQAHPSNVTAPRTHPYADNDEPLMTTISQDEPAPSSDSAELPSKGVKQTFPSRQMMQELVELFFSDIHKYLPCLHRSKFLADIDEEGALERPTALILSVLAAATSIHPDPGLKRNGADWNTQAKRMFDSAVTQGQFSLPNLQAAVWMIFYGFIVADMAEVWVLLGKAYRMACPLGFHQIDTKRTGVVGFARPPRTLEEKEERRRVMWALYLLDRGLSSGCGWPLAINDRHFMVNFPIEDDVFQSADNEDFANAFSEPFVHASFTSPTFSSPNGDSQTCYSLVLKINVLMGRIMEYNNDPDPFSCPEQRSNEFDELVAQLTRFSVSLPPKYTSLLGTSKAEGGMLLWLNFLLHSCFVLLHHPTVSESSSSSSLSNVRSPTSVSPGSVPNGAQSSEFLRCLAAVKNIIALINDAAIISSESLLNPFFAPIYAVCARILVVHFLETGDQTSRSNIDLLLLVLDRMPWTAMVNKYKNTTLRDLTRDPRSVNHIKISNGNYLEPECAPASMQSEEYHGRIPNVAQR